MHGAANEAFDDMASGYYEKPPARTKALIGFKGPPALKDRLEGLTELWRSRARADADHEMATTKFKSAKERDERKAELDAQVKAHDFSYTCNRLMSLASDEAIAEILKSIGFDHIPSTEAEWKEAAEAFVRLAKNRR